MGKLKFTTSEQYYNKLQLAFNGLVAVMLVPFALLYLDIHSNGAEEYPVDEKTAYALKILLPLMSAITAVYAMKLFTKHLATAGEIIKLRDKLVLYFNAAVWKYLTLSASLFFAILGLWATRSSVFVVVFVIILVLLSLSRPTIRTLIVDLKLDKEEAKLLWEKGNID
jgi:hypothetical protein